MLAFGVRNRLVHHGHIRRRRYRLAVNATAAAALASIVFVVALAALTSEPSRRLAADVDANIDNGPHANAFWGVYIRDLESGTVLYERNADRPLMPASNQKLLTVATALHTLGSDYSYRTPLLFAGAIQGGVMRGDLVVVGSGDPTFGSRSNAANAPDPLDVWVETIADLGVIRIEGRIIGDDNVLDDESYGDGWDVAHIGRYGFAAPIGGIVYRDNVVEVAVEGYQSGRAPRILDEPPGYLLITNEVQTSASRWSRQLNVARPLGTESLRLGGLVSRRFRGNLEIPVSDPTRFVLSVFRDRLQSAGIEVVSALVDIDDLAETPRFVAPDTLHVFESEPLGAILKRINKESDNLFAESVFRTFGWGGSSSGGERRVKSLLENLGIDDTGLSVRDGSGLSRKDLVTPRILGDLLYEMRSHPEANAFTNSLAQSGEQQTTLERRLSSYNVWAKTGSLEFVRSLSGYIRTQDDRMLAFTILVNNYPTSSSRVRLAIDEVVSAVANSTG